MDRVKVKRTWRVCALGDVPFCKAYLNDIVVYSEDWVSHFSTLRMVFKHLAAALLTDKGQYPFQM